MQDAPALSPLPLEPYEYTEYKAVKVGPDYHGEYARHWYSVPHKQVGQRLSLKARQSVVQLWHKGQCVAQHPRSTHEYKHTTNPLILPSISLGQPDDSPLSKGLTPSRSLLQFSCFFFIIIPVPWDEAERISVGGTNRLGTQQFNVAE